ncbi:MAG: hypothetical protein H0T78_04850, partial [Longispora sp.]|nr:hypothetical protein [Longispora sp. (in: high G+C Gram-positive bacteria)]
MSTYPCPRCGTAADSVTGCPGCGRPADPLAVELTDLTRRIQELAREISDMEQRVRVLGAERNNLLGRHNALLRQFRARQSTEAAGTVTASVAPPPSPPPDPAPAAPPPVRPASVQNLLLTLGGVLLGIAAIVFVAVAWQAFGLAGRAVLLLGVAGLLLLMPALLLRRRLIATAETLAAVGMLLIPLDGYAARIAGLGTSLSAAGYGAAVFATSAALAAGYAAVTRLRSPWFAALLTVQPIAPLIAWYLGLSAAGWSLAFTVTAAVNLVLVWPLLRGQSSGTPRYLTVLRALALILGTLGVLWAGILGLAPLASSTESVALRGAGAVLAAGAVPGLAAVAARGVIRGLLAAASTVAIVVVSMRLTWLAFPDLRLFALVTTGAVLIVLATLLRGPVRVGALIATGTADTVIGLLTAGLAVGTLQSSIGTALPVWQTGADGYTERVVELGRADWQLPAAIGLAVLAALLVAGRGLEPVRWVDVALVGAALLALVAPVCLESPYWMVLTVAGVMAFALGLWSLRVARIGSPAVALLWAGAGMLLGLYALAVCLADSAATVIGLWTIVGIGKILAIRGYRTPGPIG